jgi:hypothetical protein
MIEIIIIKNIKGMVIPKMVIAENNLFLFRSFRVSLK